MPLLPPGATFGRNSPAFSESDEEHIAQILLGTLAIDNQLRKRAEDDISFLIQQCSPAFVRSLVTLTVAGYPPSAAVRAHAALILRTELAGFWCDVDPDTREWLKMRFLSVLSEKSSREIRYPVLLCLSSVAVCVSKDGDGSKFPHEMVDTAREAKERFLFEEAWPEFSVKLFGNLVSEISHERRNALEVVTMLADIKSDGCGEIASTLFKYAAAIMTGLETGLADFSQENRIAAAFCAVYLVDVVGGADELPVESLSPRLLKVLMGFVEEGQFDLASSFVEMIVDRRTWYWALDLNNLSRVLLQLTLLPDVQEEEGKRRLYLCALEAMFTIFEELLDCNSEVCMDMCRRVFNICTEGLMDADNTEAFHDAECSLHRLATALGGVVISNLVRDCLGQFLRSLSWQHRHAGVCAIAEIHEASVGAFEDGFEIIVNCVQILQHDDPHPRVRSAAALTLQKLTGGANGQI